MRRRTGPGRIATQVLLVLATLVFLLPFYLLLRNGLARETDITSPSWTFFPTHIQWGNVRELFDDPAVPFARSLLNSVVVSTLQTVGTLVVCSLAGYGLARIPYRHAGKVFWLILGTLMVPTAVTFVPTFVVVSSLGWVSTLRGLVVPLLFSGLTAFLFRQHFLEFPKELEEAARIDGLGYWRTYWRIVVPNSRAFFAAIGTITFIGAWNGFLWPLVIAQDSSAWTVQIALSTFLTAQTVNLHELFTAAAVSIAPLVVLFVALQRWIVQGVERTGIDD
ncbi:multiple sugar transport system permease protein [Motilibacter rhizosphaerae]|uniref:Multiple sugar transport system permease protein n=1 Tax=Motilibacter rhizosphaerae TaxID=598652 RepID=A0A4Q7NW16_9ACTN|nr:carbohydrate ABC transporter permease [Motilibacter rhizosphaerae]RZS91354.1 multiple sugar transport system permease protein [Motilibacter rhizosphaerae]